MEDGSHLTLLCETRAGYRNLCRLITEAHAGTRPKEGADPLPPVTTYSALERRAEGLVCLSGCARHGALARAVEDSRHADAATAGRRLVGIFGRDGLRVELQRPFARHDRRRNRLLAELAERLGVPAVATGNVHAHSRARARLQDAMVAVRLGRTLDECEPWRRGNSSHALASPEAMAARFAEHPDARGRDRAAGREADLRPHQRPGLRLPGLRGSRGRLQAGGDLQRARYRALPARGGAGTGGGPHPGGAAGDRPPGPGRLLPPAPRHARTRAGGGRGGEGHGHRAGDAAARPRPGIERGLDRLLPHRPLAHRPARQRAPSRPLSQRGPLGATRHRPGLPARHSRDPDSARARPLRPRPLGAGGGVRDLSGALRGARLRQGAGAAARRDRAAGAHGRPVASGKRHRARRGRRPGSAGRLAALEGAGASRPGGGGAAASPVPAPGRHGHLDPAADRPVPDPAGSHGGPPDGAVGQGLMRRRRVPQDRPAGAGDALGGRALRRGDRPHPQRADRPVADRLRRPRGLLADPGGGDDGRLPDREPRPDVDAAADAAAVPRRRHRAGGAGAARPDPRRRRPPLHRAQEGAA